MADTPPPLSETIPASERQKIAEKLNGITNIPCPRCGHNQFGLVDGYVALPLTPKVGVALIGGQNVPCVVTYCMRCGFISLHAMGVIGLIPSPEVG